jgi:hypothetical protein
LIICITQTGQAEIKLALNPGMGIYSMTYLSNFNSFIRSTLPFQPKQLSDFPPYWNFSGGMQFFPENSKDGYAAYYSFESTGSKMSLADYSGEYMNQFIVNANSFSVEYISSQKPLFTLPTFLHFQIGYKITDLKSSERYKIGNIDTTNTMTAQANSIFLEPAVSCVYPIKFIEIGLKLGYQLDFGGEYSIQKYNDSDNYKGAPLVEPGINRVITTQWTGLRVSLNLNINLTKLANSL